MLFFTLANLTSYLAPDYGSMLVSRFAAGLPHGAFFGVAAVIAASLVSPTRRGWAISMVMAGLSVSNVIGVPAATWVGQTFGWRLLFLLVGGIGLLTLVLLWRYVPYQAPHPDASIRRELGALKRLQVWLAILIGIVGFGGFFATYTYIAHPMTLVAGIPPALPPILRALDGPGRVAGVGSWECGGGGERRGGPAAVGKASGGLAVRSPPDVGAARRSGARATSSSMLKRSKMGRSPA